MEEEKQTNGGEKKKWKEKNKQGRETNGVRKKKQLEGGDSMEQKINRYKIKSRNKNKMQIRKKDKRNGAYLY